jgi:2-dehydro-3-deoxyphosphogluconate aldolase/(4S)-4-hydroxy-2-oxoglutarate aldolase
MILHESVSAEQNMWQDVYIEVSAVRRNSEFRSGLHIIQTLFNSDFIMTKAEIIERVTGGGVIPVIRAESADEARKVIDAVVAGGIDVIEVTMTVPGAVGLIRQLSHAYSNEAMIGAGTVLTADDAKACVDAGAKFVISPALDLETVHFCRDNDVVVMPGALTPTEVVTAWAEGADFVKVFPAGAMGGASYLRSLKAPLPHIKLVPTGGISQSNAADFIRAGAEAVGVGADLVDLKAVREGRAAAITEAARNYLAVVAEARGS